MNTWVFIDNLYNATTMLPNKFTQKLSGLQWPAFCPHAWGLRLMAIASS